MGYYKKQFVEYIATHIDAKLVNFFNTRKEHYKIFGEDFYEFVSDTLDFYFEGKTSKVDLILIINKAKKNRLTKRKRWYTSFVNDLNSLDVSDPAHPLEATISLARALPTEKYVEVFGKKSIPDIIDETIQKVDAWFNDSSSYMIEFPCLHLYTSGSIYKTFKMDIILNIWEYIEKDLRGNIFSFEKKYPVALVDKPLFSPSAFTYMMDVVSPDLLRDIIVDDDGKELLEVNVKAGKLTPPKSMDSDALELLNFLISSVANVDVDSFFKEKTVVVDLYAAAKELVDYHPGQRTFDKISASCDKLVEYTYRYEDGGTKASFNLFDHIVVKKDVENPYITAVFGEVLFNAIVQHRLVSITSAHYDMLQNPLSKIICYALKKEQIANQQTLTGRYSYTYFQKIVRFRLRDKRKNIAAIKECLQEFVDSGIIISEYKYVNDAFIISFLPLTCYELEDLSGQQTG